MAAGKVKVEVKALSIGWYEDGMRHSAEQGEVVEIPQADFDRFQSGEVEKAGKSGKSSGKSEDGGDEPTADENDPSAGEETNQAQVQANAESAAETIQAEQNVPVRKDKANK